MECKAGPGTERCGGGVEKRGGGRGCDCGGVVAGGGGADRGDAGGSGEGNGDVVSSLACCPWVHRPHLGSPGLWGELN
jgi:hypothetical protein